MRARASTHAPADEALQDEALPDEAVGTIGHNLRSLEALTHSKRERLSVLCLAGGYVVGTYAGRGRIRPAYAAGAHLACAWISFLYAKGNMRWARELRSVQRPSRIAIGYHHRNGNGRGHRAMAERLQSRLQKTGFPTDIIDRSQDALSEAVSQRSAYFAKLHVGRNAAFVRMLEGTESIPFPGRFEFDWTPDMGPLDFMPFSKDTLQRADPVLARAALAEVGVETRGRQIVTVSGGGAGTGMEWRLPLVAKALEDLDVLIVGLIGDSYNHPDRRAAIETAVEGFEPGPTHYSVGGLGRGRLHPTRTASASSERPPSPSFPL